MQDLLTIKPPRRNYLFSMTLFVLTIATLSSLVSIFVFRDDLHRFSGTKGVFTSSLIGILLLWFYDEKTQFDRSALVLTENSITVPAPWFRRRIIGLSVLDKQRTLIYNSENNLRNRIQYTFWLINGESIALGKSFYGKSQVNTLLEKIGLPNA
jgi:hypothetical protein